MENRTELDTIKREATTRFVGYVTAAFGFVAGLAWNEAAKALIEHLFPAAGDDVTAKLIYAAAVTIIVVALTILLTRLFKTKH